MHLRHVHLTEDFRQHFSHKMNPSLLVHHQLNLTMISTVATTIPTLPLREGKCVGVLFPSNMGGEKVAWEQAIVLRCLLFQ